LQVEEISEQETLEEVRRLPNVKAPRPDGIANEFFKAVIHVDPKTAASMYIKCLRDSFYPLSWKLANLVLIPKQRRPPNDSASYRQLYMLNTTGKIFERLLVRRLNHFLENTNALCESQYGFRRHRSTVDVIERLRLYITNGKGNVVGMLTLDVRNAFNSAPLENINAALREMEVPMYLLDIVDAYLSDRNIQYLINDEMREFTVEKGVPKGSVI